MKTVSFKSIDFNDRKLIEKMYKDYLDWMIAERINRAQQTVSQELKRLNREDYTAKKAQKVYWMNRQSITISLPRLGVDRRCRDCVNISLNRNPDMKLDDIAKLYDLKIEDVMKVYKKRQERLKQK